MTSTKTVDIILYQSDIRPETRRDMLERIYKIYKIWGNQRAHIINTIVPARHQSIPQPFINIEIPSEAIEAIGPADGTSATEMITFEYRRDHTGYEQIICEGLTMWRRRY